MIDDAQISLFPDEPVDMEAPTVTASMVRLGLERRYADGWAVLHEVANGVGRDTRGNRRYLDTIAIGMYGSTDHAIVGHEIKVARSDWLAELRQPEKSGAFDGLVTHFYITAPKGVVRGDEVPGGWGHMIWHPSRILIAKPAPLRPSLSARDRAFVAALVARSTRPIAP